MAFQHGKIILLLLILIGNVMLTVGCGFKDIDKRIFVMSLGVDKAEDPEKNYRVTLKLAVPTGSLKEASGGNMYTYVTQESTKMADAIRRLKTQVDKEFDFGHLKSIVIGEQLLQEDLGEVMDMIGRRRDFQRIAWVAVGSPTAEKVIKTEPKSEMAASVALFNFFDDIGVESPYIVSTHFFDLRRKGMEKGIDAAVPVIKVDEKGSRLTVDHAVILHKKKEDVELSSQQTKLYNLLRNNLKKMELLVKKEDYEFMISIDSLHTKYKIITDEGKSPVVKLNIDLTGILEETDRYTNSKELDGLGKVASQYLEKRIEDFLVFSKENHIDPIGFGLRYKATRLHQEDLIKNWEQELYPKLRFDVNVRVGIKSTGVIE